MPPPIGLGFSVESGDGQTGAAGDALAQPLVVRVTRGGLPLTGYALVFRVRTGGGSLVGDTVVRSNAGVAQAVWRLGQQAGAQQRLDVSAFDSTNHPIVIATFRATAVAGPPARIDKVAGDYQSAPVGAPVPIPPSVRLEDQYGNPIAGTAVHFTPSGGAVVAGTVTTNGAGIASVGSWNLGSSLIVYRLHVSVSGSDVTTDFNAIARTCHCWVTKPPMLTARFAHATATFNGELYVLGGTDPVSRRDLASTERYDPVRDTWIPLKNMPQPMTGAAAVALGGTIYLAGTSDYRSRLFAYDPATDTWTEKTPMPTERGRLGVAVVDGVLYAIGGTTSSPVTNYGVVEAYDPTRDWWTPRAGMPTARYGLGVAVVNGVIYAVGGFAIQDNVAKWLSTVEAYDPVSDSWTTRAPMPTGRSELGAAALNGVVYAAGGYAGNLYYPPALESYDPKANQWASLPTMLLPRYLLQTTELGGEIYVTGGYNHTIWSVGTAVEAYVP